METTRNLLFMLFYYLMFVPVALLVRVLAFKKKEREGELSKTQKKFEAKDFEEIF